MMLRGLFRVDMSTADGTRRGVVYCYDDKVLGGNSVYGFIGTQRPADDDGGIAVEIVTKRHNSDPYFRPLLKADDVSVSLKGRADGKGGHYRFRGTVAQLPGVPFHVTIEPISEDAAPPVPPYVAGGISNGLYSIHIKMLDGLDGDSSGTMVLHDG